MQKSALGIKIAAGITNKLRKPGTTKRSLFEERQNSPAVLRAAGV